VKAKAESAGCKKKEKQRQQRPIGLTADGRLTDQRRQP
jgi:hypothetical protein